MINPGKTCVVAVVLAWACLASCMPGGDDGLDGSLLEDAGAEADDSAHQADAEFEDPDYDAGDIYDHDSPASDPAPADQGSPVDAGSDTDGGADLGPDAGSDAGPDAGEDKPDQDLAPRMRVILDTDANNELDDQHAIAYTLFSADVFEVLGLTVNNTANGGGIDGQVDEALRVAQMCDSAEVVPVLKGADKSFDDIRYWQWLPVYDGYQAANFIIEQAHLPAEDKLMIIAVGKLTNVALALNKDASIAAKIRVIWLGSNWPDSGEYNLANDPDSVRFVLASSVELEIATVRYGQPSGTAAVGVATSEINERMPGLGPQVSPAVAGRSGGWFNNFGDYSVALFAHSGDSARALFDVAGVAVAKNPSWADAVIVGAPRLDGDHWQARPDNPRKVLFYENFDKEAILADFFDRMENYVLP